MSPVSLFIIKVPNKNRFSAVFQTENAIKWKPSILTVGMEAYYFAEMKVFGSI